MARRALAGAVCILLCCTAVWCAETLRIADGGEKPYEEGGKAYTIRQVDLLTGNVNYQLTFVYAKEADNVILKHIMLRGGVPGSPFSKRGWGISNFAVSIGDKDIYGFPAKIEVKENGVAVLFYLDSGTAVLDFMAENQGDKVMVEMALPSAMAGVKTGLTAYPGNFNKGQYELNDRWIATAKREVQNQGESNLDNVAVTVLEKDEPWVYYYDTKNSPEGKPAFSTCALLYDPNEMEKVEVKVGNYGIGTQLYHLPSISKFHVVLWEFPGQDYKRCLEYMKRLSVKSD